MEFLKFIKLVMVVVQHLKKDIFAHCSISITPENDKKIFGFLEFRGGIETEHWT